MTAPTQPTRRRRSAATAAPLSFADVIAAGDRRASLVALRDELARRLQSADRDVPALARQLTLVLAAIDELPTPAEESKVDDLTKRRAARRAKAAGQ